ncbi:hypothetical protein D3227_25490 [Mesorhizobium waimense]|uniref:DUF680 domain-containing protein n=1 Tax=Mesorhizobium waimense TaxID=1300307 RepID=A0A3A5KKY2_9HYPH|nr:hypothetical protein [Mesorhizobium waimense]RJT33360.1 hypothetical protein D3227_25490 [Mesorhizobium waimense]
MNRLKTYIAAASAMACLVAPANAARTGNSLTSNGLGVFALNGVHVDGIVLAKSLAPAGGSAVDTSNGNLPAVQNGSTQSSTVGTAINNGLPAVQHGGGGAGYDGPTPKPRR